jgi:hypothetical protein
LDELSVIALKKLADACGNHCLLIIASAESFLPTDEQAIKLFFHQSVIVLWIKKPLKRHGLTVCIIHSVKDVLVSYEKRYLLGRMKRSMRHGCAWLWMTIRRCCQFNLNHYGWRCRLNKACAIRGARNKTPASGKIPSEFKRTGNTGSVETSARLVERLLPKHIHAANAAGFELKVILFILALSFEPSSGSNVSERGQHKVVRRYRR